MVKNKVTLNVLADITKRVNGRTLSSDENCHFETSSINSTYEGTLINSLKPRILVVFTGSNIELRQRIEELKKIKKRNIEFSLAFSFMGERILDMDNIVNSLNPVEVYREEDIFHLEEIVENHSAILGINITMNSISKVSLGMIDSFIPNVIWTFLYKEKPVYLDFTSVRNYLGAPSKNKEIRNTIENHIYKLKKMGVVEIGVGSYGNRILKDKDIPISEEKTKGSNGFNGVVTEKDLIHYGPQNPLILPKGTILTPLAKDKVKELGIKLEIEK